MQAIHCETIGTIYVVTINRPERRNAIDGPTAQALYNAFQHFADNDALSVAVLTGAEGHFCAGADLHAIATQQAANPVHVEGDLGPVGISRLRMPKPVIAAIEGYAVAGGMELALWCDLRVMAADATFGIFCRRFGVPLIDLGTVRLPRLIGHSRAMDLILTGRPVAAKEAEQIGLANRIVPTGTAKSVAIQLAQQIAEFPQTCLRNDRLSAIEQWDLDEPAAMANEITRGLDTLGTGETLLGAKGFRDGQGRHGE